MACRVGISIFSFFCCLLISLFFRQVPPSINSHFVNAKNSHVGVPIVAFRVLFWVRVRFLVSSLQLLSRNIDLHASPASMHWQGRPLLADYIFLCQAQWARNGATWIVLLANEAGYHTSIILHWSMIINPVLNARHLQVGESVSVDTQDRMYSHRAQINWQDSTIVWRLLHSG